MADLGKELQRDREEAGTEGSALASSKSNAHRLASKIDGLRERYEGGQG